MRGASGVKGLFVFFLMMLVCLGVNSETSCPCTAFQLAALCFKLTELVCVPGGRVGVGNGFGCDGGKLIEAGGECIVVVVNQVSWWGIQSEAGVQYDVRQ